MSGIIRGSIIQIHRARTVVVDTEGTITASELGIFFFPELLDFVAKTCVYDLLV